MNLVIKIRSLFHVNIIYLEYEPETERYGGDIYRKWGDAIMHISSPYSQCYTDKEFLLPLSQCSCIQFLDDNSDYSAVEGMDCKIICDDGNYVLDSWQGSHSYISESAYERLRDYFNVSNEISGTQFSVQHANIQKETYLNIEKYGLYDIRFGETAIELSPLIHGKFKKLNMLVSNCRDTTRVYSANKFRFKVNKIESSFKRYLHYIDYPETRINSLQQNLLSFIEDGLLWDSHDNYNVDDLSKLVRDIVEKRYLPCPPIFKHSKFLLKQLYYIYDSIPSTTKRKLSKLFGGKWFPHENRLIQTFPEIECILAILNMYSYNYESDIPII